VVIKANSEDTCRFCVMNVKSDEKQEYSMRLATDGGRGTVPPVVAWAGGDINTGRTWGGTLDSDYT